MNANLLILTATHERVHFINRLALLMRERDVAIDVAAVVMTHDDLELLDKDLFTAALCFEDAVGSSDVMKNCRPEDMDVIKDVLSRDRFLDCTGYNVAKCYSFSERVRGICRNYQCLVAFGEVAWAYEELTFVVVGDLGFKYVSPASCRFLENRWFLTSARSERTMLLPLSEVHDYASVKGIGATPDYFKDAVSQKALQQRIKRLSFQRALKYFSGRKRFWLLCGKVFHFVFNAFPSLDKGRIAELRKTYEKVVLVPLHVQPEASIDYLAARYRNQFATILSIRAALPDDWALVVRPHPAAMHDIYPLSRLRTYLRSGVFYSSLSFTIMDNISLFDHCVCITGTLAGQFAMAGRVSVTLEEVFFNRHPLCIASDVQGLHDVLNGSSSEERSEGLERTNEVFLEYLKRHSLPGYMVCDQKDNLDVRFIEFLASELASMVA